MSAAYYLAFTDLRRRMHDGELHPDDLVFTVDADGQHELEAFEKLQRQTPTSASTRSSCSATCRRTPLQEVGQRADELVGVGAGPGLDLLDVESGYRVFRLGALADALDYYKGYKYSETVEVAIVLCRLGYSVRNDVLVPVPVFRSRTRMKDVVIDLVAMPMAAAASPCGDARRPHRHPSSGRRSWRPLSTSRRSRSRRPARRRVTGCSPRSRSPSRIIGSAPDDHGAIGGDVAVEAVVQQDRSSPAAPCVRTRSAISAASSVAQSPAETSHVTDVMPGCAAPGS